MLYTYCKESLSFKKVKPKQKHGIILGLVFLVGYVTLTAMVSNAKQEGFKEALDIPIESAVVILEDDSIKFTQDNLVKELKRLNVRFPHIVLAQSILETGYWESRIYQENNNLFGMKQARARAYLNKLRTEKKYLNYLDRNYAEAKDYDKKLTTIIERENLKELFLD